MEITVDEVTRVAGHIGIVVRIGEDWVKATLVQKEFRGFEQLLKGRLLEEAPVYTSRICGICQVSHALASVQAVEHGLEVEVPLNAQKLREAANLAGMIQSHLIHLFLLLAQPNLKPEFTPEKMPQLTLSCISNIVRCRDAAQRIVQEICGRAIHPVTIVPGGFSKTVSSEAVSLVAELGGELSRDLNALYKQVHPVFQEELEERGVTLQSRYMSTLNGRINVKDFNGAELLTFSKEQYREYVEEAEADEGYGKRPYLKTLGYPKGFLRVGPLARLNIGLSLWGNQAGVLWRGMRHESVMYSYARLVECIHASERIRVLADELRDGVKASPARLVFKEGEGFGAVEAPRGTLIHHYTFDDEGMIKCANIITPTAFNALAVEKDVEETLRMHRGGVEEMREMALKVLRDYDPCVPCATHLVDVKIE